MTARQPKFGLGRKKDFWQRAEQNGWEKPAFYKRAWNQRWKVLLGFVGATMAGSVVHGATMDSTQYVGDDWTHTCQLQGETAKCQWTDGGTVLGKYEKSRDEFQSENIRRSVIDGVTLSGNAISSGMLAFLGIELLLLKMARRQEKTPYSKEIAYHELGHVLAVLNSQPDLLMDQVEVKQSKSVLSESGLTRFQFGPHVDLGKMSRQEKAEYYKTMHRVSNAGFAMERLLNGFETEYGKLPARKGDNADKFKEGCKLLWYGFPSKDSVKYLLTAQDQAMEVMIQYDRRMIDRLADRLAEEGSWDVAALSKAVKEVEAELLAEAPSAAEPAD